MILLHPLPALAGILGHHDGGNCANQTGWACDPSDPDKETDLEIRVYECPLAAGRLLARTTAHLERSVGLSHHCRDTRVGWSVFLPPELRDGRTHEFYAYAYRVDYTTAARAAFADPDAPADVVSRFKREALEPPFLLGESPHSVFCGPHQGTGQLERIDEDGTAVGWAMDAAAPDRLIGVRFYADGPSGTGALLGGSTATSARPEVARRLGVFSPDKGFYFPIPDQYRDGRTHELYAYAEVSGAWGPPLPGSPARFQLGSFTPKEGAPSVARSAAAGGGPCPGPGCALSWLGRQEALEVARLLQGDPEGVVVSELISRIDADPGALEAHVELERAVARVQGGAGPEGLLGGGGLCRQRLGEACRSFLSRQHEDLALQRSCGEAARALLSEKALVGRERIQFCWLLRGERSRQGPWVAAYRAWEKAVFPSALRRQAERLEPPARELLLGLDQALQQEDWGRALPGLRAAQALTAGRGAALAESPEELRELQRRLEARIQAASGRGGWDPKRLRDLSRTDSAAAQRELEAWLYEARGRGDRERFRRAEELLHDLYARDRAKELLAKARGRLASDPEDSGQLLVGLLEYDPENPEALELLARLRVAAAWEGPQPAAAGSRPRGETLRAEAHYNRGLKAYLQGDPDSATAEWRRALQLDPGLESARKALAKVRRELGLPDEGTAPPAP